MPFAGLRVLSLESRRASEMEVLIRRQEGDVFVAPSVKERALEDHSDAFRLLDLIEQNAYEMLILMTGVGLTFWRDVIASRHPLSRADDALRSLTLLARGPKPSTVLRNVGLTPDITIPEPNTWREIIQAVKIRPERRLAVQEYGRSNPDFIGALQDLGAEVDCFAIYRWDLPEDIRPLREASERLRTGQVDVILFTSSVQLEHLVEVARRDGVEEEMLDVLRSRVVIGSIGPIMTETLHHYDLRPDITPVSPKMGALVKAAADQATEILPLKTLRVGRDTRGWHAD
jgi:uroporphyrinogen-III synthase